MRKMSRLSKLPLKCNWIWFSPLLGTGNVVVPDVQQGLETRGGCPPRTEQGDAVSGECFQEEDSGLVMKGTNAPPGSQT